MLKTCTGTVWAKLCVRVINIVRIYFSFVQYYCHFYAQITRSLNFWIKNYLNSKQGMSIVG